MSDEVYGWGYDSSGYQMTRTRIAVRREEATPGVCVELAENFTIILDDATAAKLARMLTGETER